MNRISYPQEGTHYFQLGGNILLVLYHLARRWIRDSTRISRNLLSRSWQGSQVAQELLTEHMQVVPSGSSPNAFEWRPLS